MIFIDPSSLAKVNTANDSGVDTFTLPFCGSCGGAGKKIDGLMNIMVMTATPTAEARIAIAAFLPMLVVIEYPDKGNFDIYGLQESSLH
jgi:hypothetical protein